MAEFTTEGGGIHPGKPIIWPTGKPTSSAPVNPAEQAQTSGGVRGVPARPAAKPEETSPVQPTQPSTTPAAAAKVAPSVVRALTVEDIRSHLLNNQINPTDFNTKLASLMLRSGVEISRTNFVKILSMLQGTNMSQPMQEAAVLLLMKGIDSPQAVKVLGQYFAENPGLASQMIGVQESMANLTTALGMSKGLLEPTLIAQLNGLLAQFDSNLKNLTEKFSGDKISDRQNLVNDVRALKSLLQGVQEKSPNANSAEAQVLSSSLSEMQGKLDGVMQNLLSQAILSQPGRQEANYIYHEIPNSMTTPPKNFEIVIKRDGEGKDSQVDPSNTQIVMSMETTNIGKMVLSMYIKDNKVYVVFVFSEKDYGEEARASIAKEFGDLQQKLAKLNYMVTGYQVKVDPALCSIRPYLIPMISKLEDILKRIDIEA
ncbi:MAG: hypothetical protein WC890_01885 [Candidatus Margulisiibacteriota bacterium]